MYRGHVQYRAFALNSLFVFQAPQKWHLGFFVSLYFGGPEFAVIFSPVQFLSIFLLKERCVQVQALQHCCNGSQVPSLSQNDGRSGL